MRGEGVSLLCVPRQYHQVSALHYRLFLLSSRDRKQAELDLQNARRKETREMARDLESQLAAVERIAQVCRHCACLVEVVSNLPCRRRACFGCPSRALFIHAVVARSLALSQFDERSSCQPADASVVVARHDN